MKSIAIRQKLRQRRKFIKKKNEDSRFIEGLTGVRERIRGSLREMERKLCRYVVYVRF